MTAMTDSRAVEVLAVIRRGGTVNTTDFNRALDHAIARLREPAGVGGEWVLVPREPSLAMLLSGEQATGYTVDAETVWPAMLASAPHPPAEAQAQGGGEVVAVVTLSEASAGEEYPTAPLQLTEAGRRLPAGEHQLYLAPPSAPVGEFVQHPSGDGTIARKSDPLNPLAVDEILAAMNRPSAPVGASREATAWLRERRDAVAAHFPASPWLAHMDEILRALAQQPAPVAPTGAVQALPAKWRATAKIAALNARPIAPHHMVNRLHNCADELDAAIAYQQPAAVDELIDAARDYLDAEDQWNDDEEVENSEASRYRNLHVRRWKRLDAAVNALAQPQGGA